MSLNRLPGLGDQFKSDVRAGMRTTHRGHRIYDNWEEPSHRSLLSLSFEILTIASLTDMSSPAINNVSLD